ncbi:MAG: hypothetical protein GY762_16075 [Proteobacteria bacterium]|nr:hypothetical protein [Pseudomonadota bacterium]
MRVKIILPNFIVVLLVSLVSFLYLKYDLGEDSKRQLAERMEHMSLLFQRSEAFHGYEILNDVRAYAMSKKIVDVFAPVKRDSRESDRQYEKRLRATLYRKAVEAVSSYSDEWSEKSKKTPELVFLTDSNGVVIARNITPNACPTGSNVGMLPVMAQALDSKAMYGIWSIDDSPFGKTNPDKKSCQLKNAGLLELASAPVWYGDDMVGALVVGFEISNGTAKKKAEMLDLGVAFLTGANVHSSSLVTDNARQSLEEQIRQSAVAKRIEQTVANTVQSDVFEVTIEDKSYLAAVLPMPGAEKKDRVVTLVFGSLDKATSSLGALNIILIMAAVALLAVFIAGMMLTDHFLRPIMAIEEGLLKIINGAYDYRFDVESDEVGGLSYRINQLVGVLTGEEEEDEE